MGLDKLFYRIEQEEDKLRTKVLERTNNDIKNIEKHLSERIQNEQTKLWDSAKNTEIILNKQMEMKADLDRRKMFLEEKRGALSKVYDTVKDNFSRISANKYMDWIVKNIKSSGLSKPNGLIMIGNITEGEVDDKWLNNLKTKLGNEFSDCNIELKSDMEMGFIYKEGDIEMNGLISEVLRELKEYEEINISEILFK